MDVQYIHILEEYDYTMSLMNTRDTYSKLSSAPISPPPLQEYVLEGAGPWKEGIKSQTFFLHTANLSNVSYDVLTVTGIW